MPKRELEFRGIPLKHLEMYLEELGAEKMTNTFPFIYQGDEWFAHILSEEELAFTKVFKVNAVFMQFFADHEEVLEEIIKKYRFKTTRTGG